MDFVPFLPSEKQPHPNSAPIGAVNPDEEITVTILLRKDSTGAGTGASSDDAERVIAALAPFGLRTNYVHLPSRRVQLAGTVGQFQAAFNNYPLERHVVLDENGAPTQTVFRQRTGAIPVPSEIAEIITGIFGLDNRPARVRHSILLGAFDPEPPIIAHQGGNQFTPEQIAMLYNYPSQYNGSGQTVGWIELDGGYSNADLSKAGIDPSRAALVSVDGGTNKYTGQAGSADGEIALDMQVTLRQAPGARGIVFMAPNTGQGFVDSVLDAIHYSNAPICALSCSWGQPEASATKQGADAMEAAAEQATIPLFASAGDNGSGDGIAGDNSDNPASCPSWTGCGGTYYDGNTEVVWNGQGGGATGGGYSQFYHTPDIQKSVNNNAFRGVPDVAGIAAPASGYTIWINGQGYIFGGTSAVSPQWAALVARVTQATGKNLSNFNKMLYALPASAFVKITSGNNGSFSANGGAWNPCCGLGRPSGTTFLAAVQAYLGQGTTQPPTNNPPPPTGNWKPIAGLPLTPTIAELMSNPGSASVATPLGALIGFFRRNPTQIQNIMTLLDFDEDHPDQLVNALNPASLGGGSWGAWLDHMQIA